MDVSAFVQQVTPSLFGPVLAVFVALVACLVSGAFLFQKRQIPTVVTAGAFVLPAILALLVAQLGVTGLEGNPGAYASAGGAATTRFLLFWLFAPVGGIYLLLLAISGLMKAPRRWGAVALGVACVTAAGGGIMFGGVQSGFSVPAGVRAVVAWSLGVLGCLAFATGGDEGEGAEAAATAGIVAGTLFVLGEASWEGLADALTLVFVETMPTEQRLEWVDKTLETLVIRPWSWLGVVGGMGVAVAGLGVGAARGRDRLPGVLSGGLWVLVLPGVLFLGDSDHDTFAEVVETLPPKASDGPEKPGPSDVLGDPEAGDDEDDDEPPVDPEAVLDALGMTQEAPDGMEVSRGLAFPDEIPTWSAGSDEVDIPNLAGTIGTTPVRQDAEGDAQQPWFAPSGDWVAYAVRGEERVDTFIASTDGVGETRIAGERVDLQGDATPVGWLNDDVLVVASAQTLWLARPGTAPTPVFEADGPGEIRAAHAEGGQVALVAGTELMTWDLTTQRLFPVTRSEQIAAAWPVLSTDERAILTVSGGQLTRVELDDLTSTDVTAVGPGVAAAWTVDGPLYVAPDQSLRVSGEVERLLETGVTTEVLPAGVTDEWVAVNGGPSGRIRLVRLDGTETIEVYTAQPSAAPALVLRDDRMLLAFRVADVDGQLIQLSDVTPLLFPR